MNADNLKKEIKKVKVWHIALLCAGIFLAFGIIGTALVVAGGGWGTIDNGIHINLGQGKLYDVNDRAELDMDGVDNIVLGAVSDTITVKIGGSKTVAELKGQCRSNTVPVKLDARREGNTLIIEVKYPKSIGNTTTNLTVTIPADYTGDFEAGVVSGNIEAKGLPFRLKKVHLLAVSGSINFSAASYEKLDASAISGSIFIDGIAGETMVNTVSGSAFLDYTAFAPTTAVTVSGSVSANIPGDAAFKVEFGTISGGFRSSHPGLNVKSADHGFSASTSGGSELIKVNTTSGGFSINVK